MNQKGLAPVLIIVLLAVAVLGGYLIYQQQIKPGQVACTADAKICPDGSAVGRIGQNCEFTPCPSPTPDETVNWETYIHPDMKIKFKYPSSVVIDLNESGAIWLAKSTELKLDFRNRSIRIEIYEQKKTDYCDTNCTEVKINNLSGKMFSQTWEGKEYMNYFFPNPKKLGYILDVRYDEWNLSVTEEDKATFKTIISTLESIN